MHERQKQRRWWFQAALKEPWKKSLTLCCGKALVGSGEGKSASLSQSDDSFSNTFREVTAAETRESGAAASRDSTVRTYCVLCSVTVLAVGKEQEQERLPFLVLAEFFPLINKATLTIDWNAERSMACRKVPVSVPSWCPPPLANRIAKRMLLTRLPTDLPGFSFQVQR